MVLNYTEENLRDYLQDNHSKLTLKNRIAILRDLCVSLYDIHEEDLIFRILEGLRPQILPSMPEDYAQMMQKCWDTDPSKRPTIEELWDFADDKLKEIYEGKIDSNNNNSNVSNDDSSSSNSLPQAH